MLKLIIPSSELWDDEKEEFIISKEQHIQLEHSLVSLAKWESKWNKPFLSKEIKTYEESIDYIKCMTITQNIPDTTYNLLTKNHIKEVNNYIDAPMTATVFNNNTNKSNNEIITAEVIYYWMITLNIPFECQKWHLNRLLTLINVCNLKNQPVKKMSKSAIMARNKALNEQRRKNLNTRG